jgi:hypothetical protein
MAEFAEGIGAAIEGTLVAKAVEPSAGETSEQTEGATICANCGTVCSGNYCSNCGQKAHIHRTVSAIAHDLVHGVLHLDGKLSHTLPLLVFKPGRLTRRYIEGERAKFVSPMSMFLFGVFAMFALFQMVGLTTPSDLDFGGPADTLRAEGAAELARVEKQVANMDPGDPEFESRQEDLKLLRSLVGEADNLDSADSASGASDGPHLTFRPTGIDWVDEGIVKKWRENPGLMLYKLQANGYKFSWLLIPLSIPFVWAMFLWRRKFKAYDHAIFVTYSLSFMSLLFITVSLLATYFAAGGWAFALFAFGAPLHIYKHLRYTYGLSRFSTIWRFFFLMFSMLFILLIFGNALLLLGGF